MKYPFWTAAADGPPVAADGVCVGHHRVRRLMRLIGLEAIYQAPRTSVPHPMHRIYPYLLKGMAIDQPNRVWCADITYIPVQRGFLYLVAIMDWATRFDPGGCRTPWTLDSAPRPWATRWPATASQSLIQSRSGQPPASTSPACSRTRASASPWTVGPLHGQHLHRAPWRSLKYEAVYLHELRRLPAERVIGEWIGFYNTERPLVPRRSQRRPRYGAGQPAGYDGQGSAPCPHPHRLNNSNRM